MGHPTLSNKLVKYFNFKRHEKYHLYILAIFTHETFHNTFLAQFNSDYAKMYFNQQIKIMFTILNFPLRNNSRSCQADDGV